MEKVLTRVATHANTVADTFRAGCSQTKLGDYMVEMTAPEESTQGGKLALQHVRLKPPTGMAIVVGTVKLIEKNAELRPFAYVASVHEQRFRKPPPFDEQAYAAFLERGESILQALGFEVVVADAPVAPPAELNVTSPIGEIEEGKSSRFSLILAVVLALATIGAIVYFALS